MPSRPQGKAFRAVRARARAKRARAAPLATRSQHYSGTLGTIVPRKIRTVLKYNDTYELDGPNGALQTFRLNSIFDPDYTGVGHQPMGHDQLSELYQKYKVISCTIDAKIVSDSTVMSYVGFVPENDAVAPVTETSYGERAAGAVVPMPTNGGGITYFRKKYDMRRLIGGPVDSNYEAIMGANPASAGVWYLHMRSWAGDLAATTSGQANVTLSYEVEMFDTKDLAQS